MRVNWMVPVRRLWSLVRWVIHQINVWGGILISIPLIPIIWYCVLMAKGVRRIRRIVKRALSPADHFLTNAVADKDGWIYGQVDDDISALGLFAELFVESRLVRQGLMLRDGDGKTFLVTSFEPGQKHAPLAPLLAEAFLLD
ncbi:hypothetical protein QUC26_17385 [Pseudomonas asiatica]|uniref:hypothetical protein n=1 Tax=Pseudomonas asiatica TaxID=2219225 RepID=UPI0025A1ED91|nr:hypothetical protein [Pseudomonas asiatica]MDM9589532.1 hypothetical protein [Pseudomonas asiatica]WJM51645.1 hypothetical protein QUC26_17385 [Pseudomonas asiatica]